MQACVVVKAQQFTCFPRGGSVFPKQRYSLGPVHPACTDHQMLQASVKRLLGPGKGGWTDPPVPPPSPADLPFYHRQRKQAAGPCSLCPPQAWLTVLLPILNTLYSAAEKQKYVVQSPHAFCEVWLLATSIRSIFEESLAGAANGKDLFSSTALAGSAL